MWLHFFFKMHSDCQLGTAAYTIILSFTVALTLHYLLKPPPSPSLFVQKKVTLSNEQPVEAEWLWTHCEEYKITRWLSMYSKHQCQILSLASVPVLNSIPSTVAAIDHEHVLCFTFICFQEILQCLFNTRLDTHGTHYFPLIHWST